MFGDMQSESKKKKAYNKKFLERIPTLRLLDDDFFTACFQNNIECTELVLKIILEKDDLMVIRAETQYYVDDLKGHSVRLDVFAIDGNGVRYNIEVQRKNSGAIPKRARYNSSLIDAQTLAPNEDYSALPESYVIFITENDVLRKNLPIYHIDRVVLETNDNFGDGSHIIYVNAGNRDDTPLGRLMADFNNTEPKSMNYSALADAAKYFKYEDEGVSYMCEFWEELLEEGREEGKRAAEEEAKIKIASIEAQKAEAEAKAEVIKAEAEAARAEAEATKAEAEAARTEATKAEAKNNAMKNALRMIRDGLKADKIAEYLGLPKEEVEELMTLTSN